MERSSIISGINVAGSIYLPKSTITGTCTSDTASILFYKVTDFAKVLGLDLFQTRYDFRTNRHIYVTPTFRGYIPRVYLYIVKMTRSTIRNCVSRTIRNFSFLLSQNGFSRQFTALFQRCIRLYETTTFVETSTRLTALHLSERRSINYTHRSGCNWRHSVRNVTSKTISLRNAELVQATRHQQQVPENRFTGKRHKLHPEKPNSLSTLTTTSTRIPQSSNLFRNSE